MILLIMRPIRNENGDGSEETWRDYLAGIRTCLFSSSVKLRVGVLSESLVALVKDAGEHGREDIFVGIDG